MKYIKSILIFVLSAVLFINSGFYNSLLAYVMSSGNYQIQSDDSLTPTGGLGNSTNYIFRDTMGQVSSGISNSGSYAIKAGFQHMQGVSIAVSSPADTVLAPDIPGISGGTADGNVAWNVETDSYSGFDMKINSSTTPAMKLPPDGTYYFDDYSTTPTYNWSIGADSAKFGYTVVPATPADAVLAFKDDSSSCGAGSNVGNCWSGLTSSTVAIVHRQSRTSSSGESELVNFKAQSNKLLKDGSYVASITVTVSSN